MQDITSKKIKLSNLKFIYYRKLCKYTYLCNNNLQKYQIKNDIMDFVKKIFNVFLDNGQRNVQCDLIRKHGIMELRYFKEERKGRVY
jgi:hypothetical protein